MVLPHHIFLTLPRSAPKANMEGEIMRVQVNSLLPSLDGALHLASFQIACAEIKVPIHTIRGEMDHFLE